MYRLILLILSLTALSFALSGCYQPPIEEELLESTRSENDSLPIREVTITLEAGQWLGDTVIYF